MLETESPRTDRTGNPCPPVTKVLCSALVYTPLACLHRTNSPATRLQQPVALVTNPRSSCGYIPAEGSSTTGCRCAERYKTVCWWRGLLLWVSENEPSRQLAEWSL